MADEYDVRVKRKEPVHYYSLRAEKVEKGKIFISNNTITDVIHAHMHAGWMIGLSNNAPIVACITKTERVRGALGSGSMFGMPRSHVN